MNATARLPPSNTGMIRNNSVSVGRADYSHELRLMSPETSQPIIEIKRFRTGEPKSCEVRVSGIQNKLRSRGMTTDGTERTAVVSPLAQCVPISRVAFLGS